VRVQLLALLLTALSVAYAGENEFDRIVKAVQSHYGTSPTHIPLMGMANLFVKVGRPAGTTGFKLAVFENLGSSPSYGVHAELDQFMRSLSGSGLHPLVCVHSRASGESTYIYSGELGRSARLLIATFQRNEATVVEVRVSTDTLFKMIESPKQAATFSRSESEKDE